MSIKTKCFLSLALFWLLGCGLIQQLAGTPAPTVDIEAIWTSAVVTALADFNATNTALAASTAPTQTPEVTASSGWEAYRWSTLNEIIENHRKTVEADPPGMALFNVEENKYRVRAEYLSQSRPIPSEHRALLRTWAGMFATEQAEKYVALYEEEFLFREGESKYWMPVQVELAVWMRSENPIGELLTLYIWLIGVDHFESPYDWVFWIAAYE